MKKSELKVGTEYYVCPSQDWLSTEWDVKRVRITNTEHGKWKWDGINREYRSTTYSTGRSGIVVEELHKETGLVIGQTVVTLASIRGEWEPTAKEVEERRVAKRQHQKDADTKNKILIQEAGKAVAMAQQMGITGVKTDAYGRKVEVHPAIMQAMLLKLESIGWSL